MQVSPTELEAALLAHPENLISDVCVAGVPGGRTGDEKVPRAWIVLSQTGKARGERDVIEELDMWTKKTLSKYKWLRGGYEVVDHVGRNHIMYSPSMRLISSYAIDSQVTDRQGSSAGIARPAFAPRHYYSDKIMMCVTCRAITAKLADCYYHPPRDSSLVIIIIVHWHNEEALSVDVWLKHYCEKDGN